MVSSVSRVVSLVRAALPVQVPRLRGWSGYWLASTAALVTTTPSGRDLVTTWAASLDSVACGRPAWRGGLVMGIDVSEE